MHVHYLRVIERILEFHTNLQNHNCGAFCAHPSQMYCSPRRLLLNRGVREGGGLLRLHEALQVQCGKH